MGISLGASPYTLLVLIWMNTASAQYWRAASRRFIVPSPFTSKSISGMSRARSWDGWAAQWMIRSKRFAQQVEKPGPIADVDIVMLEAPGYLAQPRKVPRGVSHRTEEFGAHVVVNPDHAAAQPIVKCDRL